MPVLLLDATLMSTHTDGLCKLKISQNDKLKQMLVIIHITPKSIEFRVKS